MFDHWGTIRRIQPIPNASLQGTKAMKRAIFLMMAIAMTGLVLLMPATTQSALASSEQKKNWDFKVTIDIDWGEAWKGVKKGAGWFKSHFFEKHPTRQLIYTIDDKKVVLVPLNRKAGGTRLTDNINFDPAWKRDTPVRFYFANVPAGTDPRRMAAQQKYDESWGSDPSIGPVLRHGDSVSFNPGRDRYFANRGDETHWGATIVIVEDGLSIERVNTLPGLSVK